MLCPSDKADNNVGLQLSTTRASKAVCMSNETIMSDTQTHANILCSKHVETGSDLHRLSNAWHEKRHLTYKT